MKSRRGLSSVVGAVFIIAIVISALSYVSYSLDTMGNYSELLISEESRLNEKKQEAFEIRSITNNTASKLDGVIKNTGKIPVKLTTLWIDEQGANDVVQKFTLNSVISPGNSANLIDLVDYTIDPDKGYNMKVVSSRGEVNSFFVNSPNQQPLDLRLYSLPQTIPDEFESTLLFSVHNNMTSENLLMNIKPVDPLAITPNDINTIVTKVDGPIPASYPSLKPGDTAIFKWTYTIKGDIDDYADFTAQLENGYAGNTATDRITIGEIKLASKAVTSFSSQGFNPLSSQTQDLVFHQENLITPLNSAYQMDQKLSDAAGTSIEIRDTSPDFYTNNGTAVRVDAGNWNASLTYRSAVFPDSLANSIGSLGGLILHFEDAGNGIEHVDSDEDNSLDCVDNGKGDYAVYRGGMSVSNWEQFGGPHGSGSYTFDGTSDYLFVEKGKCVDVKAAVATLSGWFKDSSGSVDEYIYYAGRDSPDQDRGFYVKLDNNSDIVFTFKTDSGSSTDVTCKTTGGGYRDGSWHHFVAVRDGIATCELYVDGVSVDTGTGSAGSDNKVKVDDVVIGARLVKKDPLINTADSFFGGSLDDIMFWNSFAMSSTQVTDLYNTNYGNTAHRILFTFEETDDKGLNPRTISSIIAPMNFSDGKSNSQFLKSFNHTVGISIQDIDQQNRLHFTMDYDSGLNMTLRIDDNSLTTNPENSYLDLPPTNTTFFPFNTYDNDSELTAGVTSNGPFGTWLTYSGTRAILNSSTTDISYGAIIKSVNGTLLSGSQDSIFVGVGDKIDLIFHRPKLAPDNCWPPGGSCDVGLVPAGIYKGLILINGYNDQGNENTWKIDLGNVNVSD